MKKKRPNPGEEMKKKKKKRVKGQKLQLGLWNYKNAIELWVMETENS